MCDCPRNNNYDMLFLFKSKYITGWFIHLGLEIWDGLQQFFLRGRHSEEEEATVISTPQSHYAVSGQPSFDMQWRKRCTTRL